MDESNRRAHQVYSQAVERGRYIALIINFLILLFYLRSAAYAVRYETSYCSYKMQVESSITDQVTSIIMP